MRSGSKWPMIGPRPCAYACAYVDPVFTSQSYDISTSTRRTNLSVFIALTLMSTQFSLVYTCASALCLCLCVNGNQALMIDDDENALAQTGPKPFTFLPLPSWHLNSLFLSFQQVPVLARAWNVTYVTQTFPGMPVINTGWYVTVRSPKCVLKNMK